MNNAQLHLLHEDLFVSLQGLEQVKLAQSHTASHMPQLLALWIRTKFWHLHLPHVLLVKCAHAYAHLAFQLLQPAPSTQQHLSSSPSFGHRYLVAAHPICLQPRADFSRRRSSALNYRASFQFLPAIYCAILQPRLNGPRFHRFHPLIT